MRVNILRPFPLVEIRRCHDCDPDDPVLHLESRTEANQWVRLALGDPHAMEELRELMEGEPEGKAVPRLDDQDLIAAVVNAVMDGRLCLLTSHAHAGMAPVSMEEDEEEADEERPVPPAEREKMLELVSCDDHFAPSRETQDIVYRLNRYTAADEVTLEVTSEHYDDNPIFRRALTTAQKSDGRHTFQWNGRANGDSGDLQDRFIHPLLSPYKVRLFDTEGRSGECTFKVLYHSIVLRFGEHTPDGQLPEEGERVRFAQARLDALGYDAGPVNGDDGTDSFERALRRFQRANYRVGTHTLLDENGNLDAHTFAAIRAASARDRWESGKDPLTEDARFYVYDNYFNDRGEDFVTSNLPQFNSEDREQHAEDKMERPFIPLEVEIRLQRKSGQGVFAAAAVGPVLTAWEADDGPEDASVVSAASNASARTYLQNARRHGATANTGGARIDQSGDNAHEDFEGIRETDPEDYVEAWFPDDDDSRLEPYEVADYGTEERGGTPFHRALVEAWNDPAQHARCLGRAGLYFRFSKIGGDDAKVRVALTFEGRDNRDQLVQDHRPVADDLVQETGRWTVWRRAKLNAYCQQAAPTRPSGAPTWATIRDWWSESFTEIENNGNPRRVLNYTTVVPEATYKNTILAMPASHRPADVTNAASITYRAGAMYGGPDIPQRNGETAQAYVTRARNAMRAWMRHPLNAILGVIHGHVRRTDAEGLIVFDFRIHDPLTGQDWDPTLNGGAGGFTPSTNPSVIDQVSSTAGYVRLDGAVTMCVDNSFNVNCYVLHECGHARFLYHHHTGGGGAGDASRNPDHHDARQQRCTMSYAIGGDAPNAWQYPFCGKCILRLRGWDVLALPNRYTP